MNFSSKSLGETKCPSLNKHFTVDRTDSNGIFYPFIQEMIKYLNFATGKKAEYKTKCSMSEELQVFFTPKVAHIYFYGCRDGEIVTIYKESFKWKFCRFSMFRSPCKWSFTFFLQWSVRRNFPAYTSDIKVFNLFQTDIHLKNSLGEDFRNTNIHLLLLFNWWKFNSRIEMGKFKVAVLFVQLISKIYLELRITSLAHRKKFNLLRIKINRVKS